MERVWLPRPSFTFRPGDSDASDEWGMHCFPIRDRNVICVDQSGLALAFDAETRVVGTISGKGEGPGRAKRMSFSLPNFSILQSRTSSEEGPNLFDQSIFVMERFPDPDPEAENSGQFEAFFKFYPSGYWHRCLLPPPPFAVLNARKGGSSSTRPGPVEITACTVVGRGPRSRVCVPEGERRRGICLSAAGAGTYCMDMHTKHPAAWKWTQVGEWVLPFHGRVEYVPELKLWFGLCAESRRLAAADLSGMGSLPQDQKPPQLVGTWEELGPPKEWRECRDPQVVNLGSGRFCIARFFHGSSSDDGETEEDFAVLTGVEVVPCLHDHSQAGKKVMKRGKKVTKLRMIRHMSRRLHGGGTIDTVF